ncbi:MAG: InlB B-repeat-containing protein, partial [Muribaculaceae bacterium]|nr:InlB B-repeat-containing protein [Muribaculaceae bacterium]
MKRISSIILMCLMQILTVAASTFSLNVEVTPAGAASPNTRGGTYEEGEEISLRVSGHTGFVFKGWYAEEEMVSSATNFRYTMPSHDVTIQAKFEYDPAAPDNPAMPDTTTYYSLTATPSPAGAASLNLYEGKYAANASVNMRANGRTGYVFDGWQNDKGETLSSATSFSFKMPAHNTHLTAVYHYDPTTPADPNQMGTSYTTVLKSRPAGGGSFNTTSVTLEEGSNARVYAYTNTGFRFLRWEDEDSNTISENRDFYYVMPHGGGTLYGVFDYDPEPPANPAKNYWNKELGEVIVDDFTPGSLNSALSSVISGSNRNDVTMITVAGVMTSNDFGIANNYPECTLLDLSRVTGVTEIPSYAFDNTTLETVTLPATIEKIGTRAFENCKQLAALSIYAMTPPTLENNVFRGIPDGLIVYVPAAAVAQYQDADIWKDFTILPIQEDVRSLTVSLPSNMSPESFARMWLEIRNIRNGQRLHYVMTDRQAYTFANIIRNTTWDVTLRNERGDIFGQINNVEVKDDDISVEFKDLSLPQTISLTVLTPDGEDVSDMLQIGWTDATGNYLGQSTILSALPTGMEVRYILTLPQALAMQYALPESCSYTVADTGNEIECTLSPIPQVKISGKINDSTTSFPISGSIVTASQTFGGKYNQTITGKSDRNGEYTLTVFNVPTSLTASASDYVSHTMVCDSLMSSAESITIPQIALKPISGAVISLGFTYQKSVAEGEAEESQDWYDNYSNVTYSIFNKTKNRPVTQFNVQYLSIVLLEEVSEADVLEITA